MKLYVGKSTRDNGLKVWRYLSLFICLTFVGLAHASSTGKVHQALESRFSCQDRNLEDLCFLSIDKRDNELIIFLSSALYRMNSYSKADSFLEAANLSHEIYQSITSKVDSIDLGGRSLVVIMDIIFKGERLTTIHDVNSTVFVDLDKRIDIYQLLNNHRQLVAESPTSEKQKTLQTGERLAATYEVTTAYEVVSSDAIKNDKTGQFEISKDVHSTGKKVQHTKITHVLVWFPLP